MKRLAIVIICLCATMAMWAQENSDKLILDLQKDEISECKLNDYDIDKSGNLFLIMSDDSITINQVKFDKLDQTSLFLVNGIGKGDVKNSYEREPIILSQDTLTLSISNKQGNEIKNWKLRTIPKKYDVVFESDDKIIVGMDTCTKDENGVFHLPTGQEIGWLKSKIIGDLKIQEDSSTIEVLKETIKGRNFAYYQTNGDFQLKEDKVYTFTIGDKSWKVNYPQEQATNNCFQSFKAWGWMLLIGIVVLFAINFGFYRYKKKQKHPQGGADESDSPSDDQGNEKESKEVAKLKNRNKKLEEEKKELIEKLKAKNKEPNKKSSEPPVQGKNDTAKTIDKILLQVNNKPNDGFKRLGEIWKECGKTNESLKDFFNCIERKIENNPVPNLDDILQEKNNRLSQKEEEALYRYVYAQLTDQGISVPPSDIAQLVDQLKHLDAENEKSATDEKERDSNPLPKLNVILQEKNNSLSPEEEEALYRYVRSQLTNQEIPEPPLTIDQLAEQLKQLEDEKGRLAELESVSREMEKCEVSTVEELKQQTIGNEMDKVLQLSLPRELIINDCTEPHQVVSKLIAYTENIANQQRQTQQRIDNVKEVLSQYECPLEDGNEAEELRRWCEQQKAEQEGVRRENTELKEQRKKTIEKIKECFDSDCDNLHEYVKQGGVLRACDSSDSSDRLREENEDMLFSEMEQFMEKRSQLSIEGDCPEFVYREIQDFLRSQLEENGILNLCAQYYAYSRLAFMTDRRQGIYGVYIHQEKMTTVFNSMSKLLADFGIQILLPTLFAEKLTANSFENVIGHAGNLDNLCPQSVNYKEYIPLTDKRGIMIDLICPGYSMDGQVVKKAQVTILQ